MSWAGSIPRTLLLGFRSHLCTALLHYMHLGRECATGSWQHWLVAILCQHELRQTEAWTCVPA